MKWSKSGLYTMLTTVSSRSLERHQREWVSWDLYVQKEGKVISEKQKEQGLLQDSDESEVTASTAFRFGFLVGGSGGLAVGPLACEHIY